MPIHDVVIRILLAAVLGGIIGIEREIREHTAGFRTHILVEKAVVPGENDSDTIHLLLKLPRGLSPAKLTSLIADLKEVRTVSLD